MKTFNKLAAEHDLKEFVKGQADEMCLLKKEIIDLGPAGVCSSL